VRAAARDFQPPWVWMQHARSAACSMGMLHGHAACVRCTGERSQQYADGASEQVRGRAATYDAGLAQAATLRPACDGPSREAARELPAPSAGRVARRHVSRLVPAEHWLQELNALSPQSLHASEPAASTNRIRTGHSAAHHQSDMGVRH